MSLNAEVDPAAPDAPDAYMERSAAISLERRMHPAHGTVFDGMMAAGLGLLLLLLIHFGEPTMFHWSVIPALIAGSIMGKDMIALIRGKMDIFDLKGILGTLGFLFFFITHTVHVYRDSMGVPGAVNGREWFGYMAVINIAGALIYLAAQRRGFAGTSRRARTFWRPPATLPILLVLIIIVSVALWLVYLRSVGGLESIARNIYERRPGVRGFGPLVLLGEAAPALMFLGLTLLRGAHKWYTRKASVIVVLVLVAVMFAVQMYISAAAGSRSRVLWSMFAIAGMIHYYWRPLRRTDVVIALIPITVFLHLMSLYKEFNVRLFSQLEGASLSDLQAKATRSYESILIGDIGRTGNQARVLHAIMGGGAESYNLRFGKTYVYGFLNNVPGWIWSQENRPRLWSKAAAAAEVYLGKGSYSPMSRHATSYMQYGLAAEAMMNFGLPGVPVMFWLWGFAVGRLRRLVSQLQPGDLRLVACIFLINALFVGLPSDFDNIVDVILWKALVPLIVIWWISQKVPGEQAIWAGPSAHGEAVELVPAAP